MIVYKNILEQLKNAGWSTTRLRREKILSESVIQRIRNGESINTNTIDIICELCGCKIDDLIEHI